MTDMQGVRTIVAAHQFRRKTGSLMALPRSLRMLSAVASIGMGGLLLTSCQGNAEHVAQLPPTLTMRQVTGGTVAFQSGIPVPSFSYQERGRLDLGIGWRMQAIPLDQASSFSPRDQSLPAIEQAAAGRTSVGYADQTWQPVSVPGGSNPPPAPASVGAWYRLHFSLPTDWPDGAVTLKFATVNYLADVWLNGAWLGYHEGGSTPFAFDATQHLHRGSANVLAVRVVDPPFGSRLDVVPWGLTDFWNYAGIIGPVWIETTGSPSVVRADVTPHLDAADIDVVVENRGGVDIDNSSVHIDVLPALVTDTNRLDPDALHLVPAGAAPVASTTLNPVDVPAGNVQVLSTQFEFRQPDLWSLTYPALYVLVVTVDVGNTMVDQFADTFGLRTIHVDSSQPALQLNDQRVVFDGAAIHNESVIPARADGSPRGGRWQSPSGVQDVLRLAARAGLNLIRADHAPAEPNLLRLSDRTGFAVWEEIPLYHETPQTFSIAADRGIAVQMLREMDLRDMNHPSVLFHGFANEGLGVAERENLLDQLSQAERQVDGTRLTGQAMYGSNPSDPTSRNLDVAGYTMYEGVFYGTDAVHGTAAALGIAHATYPAKPIMVMEFGRWSDSAADEAAQAKVFSDTWKAISPLLTSHAHGYVAAAVWWSLQDYWSDQPANPVEHFGMFHSNGTPREVAAVAESSFTGPVPAPDNPVVASGGIGRVPVGPDFRSLGLLMAYAAAFALVLMSAVAVALTYRRRRGSTP
jgi:beta-glucuronidase